MSYVSGFMLGASIGKAIHSMLTADSSGDVDTRGGQQIPPKVMQQMVPQAMPAFACVSAVKGRRRYRAAGLIGNTRLASLLQMKLASLAAVQSVQLNVRTGSILVFSSNEQVLDELEKFFRTRLFPDTEKQIEQEINAVRKVEKEVESVYSNKMYETADCISNFISQKTNRILDLRSLIALIFIVRGIHKTVTLGQRPSGPQMIWWATALLGRRG